MATNFIDSGSASVGKATLLQAPVQISINGKELRLETYLWRDFMPTIVPDDYVETSTIPGSALIAKLKISTVDKSEFPADVKADLAWIILDNGQIWTTPVIEERPRISTNPVLEVMARNGPKWGPHVNVDVVVQLTNTAGETVLLQAKHQKIGRTD